MTLNIIDYDLTVLPQIIAICTRLKSLTINNYGVKTLQRKMTEMKQNYWKSQQLAHQANPGSIYALQELSISWSCAMSLWGFISRSPDLRVLKIYPRDDRDPSDEYEMMRMDELVRCLNSKNTLPCLQHLDISLDQVNEEVLSKVTKSMRRLRSFQFQGIGSLSVHDFRPHFSTLTVINVQSSPEFWQEVLTSCPALVKAQEVRLYEEDILRGGNWASTDLTFLYLTVHPDKLISSTKERSRIKVLEDALFRRIAKLLKLDHLSVHSFLRDSWSLDDQSWQALSKIKTLASLELGSGFLGRPDESAFSRISKLRMLKNFHGVDWGYGNLSFDENMIINKIENLGVSVGSSYFHGCRYFTNSETWLPL
jgi:hypothetical protein